MSKLSNYSDEEIQLMMAELEVRRAREEQESLAKSADALIYIAHLEDKVKRLEDNQLSSYEKKVKKLEQEVRRQELEDKGKQIWQGFKNKIPKIRIEFGEEEKDV